MKLIQRLFLALLCIGLLVATLGAGVWLLNSQAKQVYEGWQSRSWQPVSARVAHSVAVHKYSASQSRQGGKGTHVLELRYVFGVAGKAYTGARRSLDWEGKVLSSESALKQAQRLPAGSLVTAYYNPADPRRSMLEPGVPVDAVLGSAFAVLLIAAGAALLLLIGRTWLGRAPSARAR